MTAQRLTLRRIIRSPRSITYRLMSLSSGLAARWQMALSSRLTSRVKLQDAETYWSIKRNDPHAYAEILYDHLESSLGERLRSTKRMLEFGAGCGQNLTFFMNKMRDLMTVGVDVNPVVLEPAGTFGNYTGIVGNQDQLAKFAGASFDVAFTLSVLDHIPSRKIVKGVVAELLRVCERVILFEPYIEGIEGDVSGLPRARLKSGLPNPHKAFAKHTYLWDYPRIARDLGAGIAKRPYPLHPHSAGPFYHIFDLDPQAKSDGHS